MNTSIRNMNWTTGQRELQSNKVHPLTLVKYSIRTAYELQSPKQDEYNRLAGNNLEANALHSLIVFLDTDPDHILNAEQDITETINYDPYLERLNRTAGYDIVSEICAKTPERVKWEQEYLAKRANPRPLYEVKR